MLAWLDGETDDKERFAPKFDGTISSFADCYESNVDNAYQELKENSAERPRTLTTFRSAPFNSVLLTKPLAATQLAAAVSQLLHSQTRQRDGLIRKGLSGAFKLHCKKLASGTLSI
jgi:hypothetical protein